jgi:methyl-accepting chemotaxis protein
MTFLRHIKVKNKLRIPLLLLLLLLLTFIYFYFTAGSSIRRELTEKSAVTEAGNKMRTLFCTFMDSLNQKNSFEQLNTDYQDLLQWMKEQPFFEDREIADFAGLQGSFKKIETLVQESSQKEKQLLELLDRASQGPEGEEKPLNTTSAAQLHQQVKETMTQAKAITAQWLEHGKSINPEKEKIAGTLKGLLESLQQSEAEKTGNIVAIIKRTLVRLFVVMLVILFLVMLVIYVLGKLITIPIHAMIERAHDLAVDDVDMTRRLQVDSRDEIGELSNWFNKFLDRLQQLIIKVKSASDEIYHATKEITAGSEDLEARTNSQSSSITETSSTLGQFSESIRQNTENSAEADMMLVDFNQEIQEKSSLIDNVTTTMTEIFESSKQIDNIIKVINDISFQTNLLALNAAVEAARAGEAGRGFAVVAAEVRNLAQKTAESSKTIQDIVMRNVESTQKGMELVKDTSEFFGEIVGVMGEIVQKVSNITEVSREQSDSIEKITQTISQMDQMSDRNTQLVEEFSETGRKVKDNAMELQQLVSRFKLDETMQPGTAAVPDHPLEPSSSPSPPRRQETNRGQQRKSTAKEPKKESIPQARITSASTSPTEDDFFGSTNEDGFEEF